MADSAGGWLDFEVVELEDSGLARGLIKNSDSLEIYMDSFNIYIFIMKQIGFTHSCALIKLAERTYSAAPAASVR